MNKHTQAHYIKLAAMTLASFVAMYLLMYSMVDRFAHLYPNLNQFYMAGLMAAPMPLIELALMWAMYPDKKLNTAIIAVCVLALAGFFLAIRTQTAVGDVQFLKSMIPHHSGAILMCGKAAIKDQRIAQLCERIVAGQQEEIDEMTARLGELGE